MKILTAEQIREIDRLSTKQFAIPSILLMENAGMRVVEALEERFEDLEELTIAILCGRGNNGGDGFVVARQLIQKGSYPFVFLFAEENEVKGDAKTNLEILKAIGCPPTVVTNEHDWYEERLEVIDADIIVDALFGTGLSKPITGLYKSVVETLDDFARATVVSVDVPSGLETNHSRVIGPAVEADLTVTFTGLKPCLVLPPSHDFAGDVIVADIGNPHELLESGELNLHLIEPSLFPKAQQIREADTNKGDYGKVLVIGGSRGKSGAAAMAGQAALRSGAGLVTVATASGILPSIAVSMPELMTESLAETGEGTIASQDISAILRGKTVLAIGPGLTTHSDSAAFVRGVVRDTTLPIVIDADGLNAFVGHTDKIRGDGQARILTPHPGEMARLLGTETAHVVENRVAVARTFATDHKVYVVLKGFRTVVATPDGSVYVNSTGNPGMATGGTGDVLTGMIVGILGQESLGDFVERLCLAVYLHGLAGDLAAEELGEEAMVATDILRFLPAAWKQLRS
jgi:ADP-dependent NAD(P)H-hydrate dehydratase / NAD(P)H-hydrate epimerase